MKNKRILLFLITIVCIFALNTLVISASTSSSRLNDKEGYITKVDAVQIEEKLKSAEESTGVAFRVYVYEYSSTEGYVDMYDYEREVGESFTDLVLLVISYEYGEYYYELFTKGTANTAITDKEVNKILDNDMVYDNIKSGKLYDGINAYVTLAQTAVEGKLRNSFKNVFIPSLVISLMIAIGASVGVMLKYRKKLHSESYPLDRYAKLDLSVANDNFITKTVSRVRVRDSSSSSGGGGRSSGGGSRGRR